MPRDRRPNGKDVVEEIAARVEAGIRSSQLLSGPARRVPRSELVLAGANAKPGSHARRPLARAMSAHRGDTSSSQTIRCPRYAADAGPSICSTADSTISLSARS